MRRLSSLILVCAVISIGQTSTAAVLCKKVAEQSLVQQIWRRGFDHPLYQRATVKSMMAELLESMQAEHFMGDTDLSLRPKVGTKGLYINGSYVVKPDELLIQVWDMRLIDQINSFYGETLPLGDHSRTMNLSFGQFTAAVEGASRLFVKERGLGVKHLRIRAADIRNPLLMQMLEDAGFSEAPGVGGAYDLLLDF